MSDMKLYPTKGNLRKGVVYGLITLGFSGILLATATDVLYLALGALCFGLGGYLVWTSVQRLRTPTPVFEADLNGFSVKGKAKRPWNEFRGVEVYKVRSGFFTVAKYVRVKVGNNMLGGTVQIGQTFLSGPPDAMAAEIGAYADFIQKFGFEPDMGHEEATAVQSPPATDPVVSFADRLSAHNGGPVSSVPSVGERIFGRRKVL